MSEGIREATWRLPEGHESVGAFASREEAHTAAQGMVRSHHPPGWTFYISSKRGAWEVIRQPLPDTGDR